MRAGEEWRLPVRRHDLVEHQDQRGGEEADPDGGERGAAEPVAMPVSPMVSFSAMRPIWPNIMPTTTKMPKNQIQFCSRGELGLPASCGAISGISATAIGAASR